MIRVNLLTPKIQVKLISPVVTQSFSVFISFITTAPTTKLGYSNVFRVSNSTPVDIIITPAIPDSYHDVDQIDILNVDTISNTVIVSYLNGINEFVISKASLSPGDHLMYNDTKGWSVIDSSGAQKQYVTTNGILSLNGQTGSSQIFSTGTSGTDFNIASASNNHTFNIPTASSTNRGALSNTDWTIFNSKEVPLTFSSGLTRTSNNITNNLITGIAGGQTIIGGTNPLDHIIFKPTTGIGAGTTNAYEFLVGNNGSISAFSVYNNGGVNFNFTISGISNGLKVKVHNNASIISSELGVFGGRLRTDQGSGGATITDGSAAGARTLMVADSFLSVNFASVNAITVADCYTVYIDAPASILGNITATRNWSFGVATGGVNFGGLLSVGQPTVFPTAYIDIKGGTTSFPSLRINTGVAPTTPLDGFLWYDTSLRFRKGATTYDLLALFTDYVFAYDTTTQTVALANVFQDITFNTNVLLNGWTHTVGTASFTCGTTGSYLIEVNANTNASAGAPLNVELRLLKNGVEISASQIFTGIQNNNLPNPISGKIISSFAVTDVLKVQLTGSKVNSQIITGSGNSTVKQSIKITVVRLS